MVVATVLFALSSVTATLTVYELSVMVYDLFYETVPLEVLDGDTCEGSVDLHSVDEDRLRDHLESGDLLEDLVVGGLVQDNHVLCLDEAWMSVGVGEL